MADGRGCASSVADERPAAADVEPLVHSSDLSRATSRTWSRVHEALACLLQSMAAALLWGLSLAFNKQAAVKKPPAVELLSISNATQLKTVFFSGDPWLVQCGAAADLAAAASDPKLAVHEVVELALPKLGASVARVGLLD